MSKFLLSIFVVVSSIYSCSSVAAFEQPCVLSGDYSYVFNGTSFNPPPLGTVPFTETGVFKIKSNNELTGKSDLIFQFADFSGTGPLWIQVSEEQTSGQITQDEKFACLGTVGFLATGTVIQTSNPAVMPEGTVLYVDLPRSLSYTISGNDNQNINLVFTSMGMMASGTGHRQKKNLFEFPTFPNN
jgi:hypothetical protein